MLFKKRVILYFRYRELMKMMMIMELMMIMK
jgi:hypothetical protein